MNENANKKKKKLNQQSTQALFARYYKRHQDFERKLNSELKKERTRIWTD